MKKGLVRFSNRRMAAALLVVLMLVLLLFSLLFLVKEADHTCTGRDCQICFMMEECGNMIRMVESGAVFMALVSSLISFHSLKTESKAQSVYFISNLVSEKIRMND